MEIPDIERYTKSKKKIDNQRQEAIHNVMELMGEEYKTDTTESKKRYKYWNGRLRKYSPIQIHGLIKDSKEGKNPPALFNWLLKQDK